MNQQLTRLTVELGRTELPLVQTVEKLQKLSEELAKVALRMGPSMLKASSKGASQAVNAAVVGVGRGNNSCRDRS